MCSSGLRRLLLMIALGAGLCLSSVNAATANAESIIVQSTTSTQNAGFYEHIIPLFEQASGIKVKVVAVGTGQALQNARNCDGDLLIVHSTKHELAFVAAGFGLARHNLMYNDFILLGPKSDPAGIRGGSDIGVALSIIASKNAKFASRGDNSGTNEVERLLWALTDTKPDSSINGWYLETGRGMGATLNFAVQSDSYTLSDRATWLAFGNKMTHEILLEGDPRLFNQYGVVTINPARCPKVKSAAADKFVDWLLSAEGQTSIGTLMRDSQLLFFPNAN